MVSGEQAAGRAAGEAERRARAGLPSTPPTRSSPSLSSAGPTMRRCSRVMEIRRERAERARARTERPLLTRLFRNASRARRRSTSYELLRIDPNAEPPLIARAYSILRTLHLRESDPRGAKGIPQQS